MDRNGIVKKAENHVQIEIKKIQHFIEKARQAEEDNKMQSFIESKNTKISNSLLIYRKILEFKYIFACSYQTRLPDFTQTIDNIMSI